MRSSLPTALRALVLALAAGLAFGADASAPIKIWVALKDKGPAAAGGGSASAPGAAVPGASARAFEDLPVYAPYVAALELRGFKADVSLKWQNRVSGYVDAEAVARLRALPFVAGIAAMPRKAKAIPLPFTPAPWRPNLLAKRAAEGLDYGQGRPLMESLHVDKVHAYMIASGMAPGRGVRVAVIDADFHLGSPIFAAMKGRIRDQYDFVDKKPITVTDSLKDSHGAECMSLIGGNVPGTLVGVAPEADFLLYRAEEDAQERYVEEDYVAAAIERAVDSGAQVISISLGYRYDYTDGSPDLPFAEFDGRTRPSSLAALGAARRNVLVSVSMGNDGVRSGAVPSISAPADADSILAVGIADPFRRKCPYSSIGPSADGRVKPDILSMGVAGACNVAVADPLSDSAAVNDFAGTSFAAPVLAGIAASLRQLRPALTAEDIRQALITTADRYAQPDSGRGYGVADAVAAARKLGIPINPPLVETGNARMYHRGGAIPMVLGWAPGMPRPDLRMIDLSGRRIPITVQAAGGLLYVTPDHPLQTGIYIAHIP